MTEPTPDMSQPTEPTDAQIEELLLSVDEMSAVYATFKTEGRDTAANPLELHINNDVQKLIFLGPNHSNRPDRPDLALLLNRWSKFVDSTIGKKRIVLVEGGVWDPEDTRERALRRVSESCLFCTLAAEESIQVVSPEPDRQDEIIKLGHAVGHDETAYYYFARMAAQWQRTKPDISFEDYLSPVLDGMKKMTGWDYDFSVKHMAELYQQKHVETFDPETAKLGRDHSPSGNPVSALSSRGRDINIIKEIAKYWYEGKSIFVVYGGGHLITQREALTELLSHKEAGTNF